MALSPVKGRVLWSNSGRSSSNVVPQDMTLGVIISVIVRDIQSFHSLDQ